jgi:hypothetical protein
MTGPLTRLRTGRFTWLLLILACVLLKRLRNFHLAGSDDNLSPTESSNLILHFAQTPTHRFPVPEPKQSPRTLINRCLLRPDKSPDLKRFQPRSASWSKASFDATLFTPRSPPTIANMSVLDAPRRDSRFLRRLSSQEATRKDLANMLGPTVVVPPKHLMAPSEAHEVAASMELARHELEEFRSATASPASPGETLVTDKFAFAFDIDGVLIKGGSVIPEAIEAMKALNGQNEYGIKV